MGRSWPMRPSAISSRSRSHWGELLIMMASATVMLRDFSRSTCVPASAALIVQNYGVGWGSGSRFC